MTKNPPKHSNTLIWIACCALAVAGIVLAIHALLNLDNAEVDELIDKILMEVDEAKRQSYYDRLQEVMYEEGTLVNVQVPYYVAMRPEVKNFRQPPSFMTQYEYTSIEE